MPDNPRYGDPAIYQQKGELLEQRIGGVYDLLNDMIDPRTGKVFDSNCVYNGLHETFTSNKVAYQLAFSPTGDGGVFYRRCINPPVVGGRVSWGHWVPLHTQSGQQFIFNSPSSDQYAYICTLPASNAGTFDRVNIRIFGSLGAYGDSSDLRWVEAQYTNRGGFAARVRRDVAPNIGAAGVRAYQQSDGSVDLYLYSLAGYYTAFVVEAKHIGASFPNTGVPPVPHSASIEIGTASSTVPPGTLIGDTRTSAVSIPEIIDYGENANGSFERWSNGVQRCWFKGTAGVASGNWNFPAAFAAAPLVTAQVVDNASTSLLCINLDPPSTTSVFYRKRFFDGTNLGDAAGEPAVFHAIGKWF